MGGRKRVDSIACEEEHGRYHRELGTTMNTWTVSRQIAFFKPSDDRGKWHAAWLVTHTPVCGASVPLGTEAIHSSQGQDSTKVHPLVCRRCLRLSTTPGVSATGIKR